MSYSKLARLLHPLKLLAISILLIGLLREEALAQYSQTYLSTSQYDVAPYLYVDGATIQNYRDNFNSIKGWTSFAITVVNASTKEQLKSEDAVVISVSFDAVVIEVLHFTQARSWRIETFLERGSAQSVNINYRGEEEIKIPISANLATTTETERFLIVDKYTHTYSRRIYGVDVTIRTSAKGYEIDQRKISIFGPDYRTQEIALIPQIQNVNMSGNLSITNEPNQNDKLSALNLLSTIQVAEAFGITEKEVIELIKAQRLKAKKVGEKYFIRKEDFDEFMKKSN